ncbi:MAG: acetyl-CoA carboxylase carboxyltransferase subunit alpha/beta [Acidimicrobiia bacterium]|nr:acetyl-CoA carboxylase carboxyltransferase subunit alpha/beta [Acidimicrobiia bacterium]
MNFQSRIESLLDHGLEEAWDEDVVGADPLDFPGYAEQLAVARERTGLSEAVVTGVGECGGRRVALILSAFDFMGGSMGVAVGERIARGFDRAADRGLPVVSVLASGGARMQEGLVSLAQMPKTLAAAQAHSARGLLQVTVCTNPTAGGMWASFGSQADVVFAEVGATLGFAGPRIAEAVTGEPLPGDAHTPEAAYMGGVVDAVVGNGDVAPRIRSLLAALDPAPEPVPPDLVDAEVAGADGSGWDMLEAVRRGEMRGTRRIVEDVVSDFTRLSGDRAGGTDPSILAGIGRWRGRPVVVIGQDRHAGGGRTRAAGFRLARRACELAGRLHLPAVTLIDTPGADPAHTEDRSGLVPAISALAAGLLACPTPVVCVCVGEGGSGGALAFGAGDALLMQQGSVFTVIAPASAAQILRHGESGATLATRLRIRDADAVTLGVADGIVPADPGRFADTVAAWLDALTPRAANGALQASRLSRWRRVASHHLKSP